MKKTTTKTAFYTFTMTQAFWRWVTHTYTVARRVEDWLHNVTLYHDRWLVASDTVGWTSDGEIIRRMLNLCMFEGRCVTYIYCPFFCWWDFNVFNWEELRASCSRACVIWKSQISDIFIFIIIVILIFVIVITSLFSLFIYSMPIHLAIPISPPPNDAFQPRMKIYEIKSYIYLLHV